jgi:hypothetical protein
MDRALYVWLCSRAGCQRNYGRWVEFIVVFCYYLSDTSWKKSIRAFRGLSFNSKYAAKLKRKSEKSTKPTSEKTAEAKKPSNPFAVSFVAIPQISYPDKV